MQHLIPDGHCPIKAIISGLAWVLGLLLAGSDGAFMPWTNIAGILLFGAAGWLMTSGKKRSVGRKNKRVSDAAARKTISATGILRGKHKAPAGCYPATFP